jgi:hypothetical protein
LAKKRHLSRELKRRGARVVGEVDHWKYEQFQLACDFYIQELKQFLLSKESRKQHDAINYLTTKLNKSNKAVRLKMHHISSILVNSDLPYLEYFSPIPCAEIGLIDWNETQALKTLLVEKFNDPRFVEFLSSLSDKKDYPTNIEDSLQIESPPEIDVFEHLEVPEQPSLKIRPKIDYIEREIRNTKLGEAGETWVINFEKKKLVEAGLAQLSNKIVWASKEIGDGLGYDIISYDTDGSKIYIEVKTTSLGKYSAFYLSQKEIEASSALGTRFVIYRIFDFDRSTKFFKVGNNLKDTLDLVATTFRATPRRTNAQEDLQTNAG